MKPAKLSLAFVTLALGIASAASSYKITIPTDLWAGDTQLKAGEYKVTVEGKQATFMKDKQTIQVPATVEQAATKAPDTMLESSGAKLEAIEIGGTTTKVVIAPGKNSTAEAQ